MSRLYWDTFRPGVDEEDLEDQLLRELVDELAAELHFPDDTTWNGRSVVGEASAPYRPWRDESSGEPEAPAARAEQNRAAPLRPWVTERHNGDGYGDGRGQRGRQWDEEGEDLSTFKARASTRDAESPPKEQSRNLGAAAVRTRDNGTSTADSKRGPRPAGPAAEFQQNRNLNRAGPTSLRKPVDVKRPPRKEPVARKPGPYIAYRSVLQKYIDEVLGVDVPEEDLEAEREQRNAVNTTTTATQTTPKKAAPPKGKAPKKQGKPKARKNDPVSRYHELKREWQSVPFVGRLDKARK
ncbi:hypothetical protein DFJ74DRAFT_723689 [Hyaloraphidium curvatum]|nr:hypothetical protein DFJ74DRAFT_723689 [Hyaloraphidium curvatum]